jgi:hypothetical protein
LTRELRAAARDLAGTWALVVDDAAAAGAPEVVSARAVEAARRLLAVSEEPVRDVLRWATKRDGRPVHARMAWHDVVRVLRNASLDDLFPPRADPWIAIRDWRARWRTGEGAPVDPDDVADGDEFGFELSASGYLGGWALRRGRSARVGAAAWPGASCHRFALHSLGLWDALSEAGSGALLPLDDAAPALPAALWPLLLAEAIYARRVLGAEQVSADALRSSALAEALWNRLGSAAVLVLDEFQRSRSIEQALDAAETRFGSAVFAPVPPELALLLCRPFAGPGVTAPPDAVLAAHALTDELRQSYDVDWWRNPRSLAPLRGLWSRCAGESLEALLPAFTSEKAEASFAKWLDATLGG